MTDRKKAKLKKAFARLKLPPWDDELYRSQHGQPAPENVRQAFHEMRENCVPAVQRPAGFFGPNSGIHFCIDCELLEEELMIHIDYYSKYGGSMLFNGIMARNGLYCEWEDAATVLVSNDYVYAPCKAAESTVPAAPSVGNE
jgi:hypothetical protein